MQSLSSFVIYSLVIRSFSTLFPFQKGKNEGTLVLLSEKLVTFKEWERDAEGSRSWRESLSHLIYSKGITSTSDRNKGIQSKDSRLSSCLLFREYQLPAQAGKPKTVSRVGID